MPASRKSIVWIEFVNLQFRQRRRWEGSPHANGIRFQATSAHSISHEVQTASVSSNACFQYLFFSSFPFTDIFRAFSEILCIGPLTRLTETAYYHRSESTGISCVEYGILGDLFLFSLQQTIVKLQDNGNRNGQKHPQKPLPIWRLDSLISAPVDRFASRTCEETVNMVDQQLHMEVQLKSWGDSRDSRLAGHI
jgi:hypothetical protein